MSKVSGFKSQKDAEKALVGKKVKIIASISSGHGIPLGTKVEINRVVNPTGQNPTYYTNYMGINKCFYINEMQLTSETIEELEKDLIDINNEIVDLNTEKESIRSKIQFMEDNKLEIYDKDTFKAFSTLSLLDNNKLSKIEKAKLISKLIKG